MPFLLDVIDYKVTVAEHDISLASSITSRMKEEFGCSEEFFELACTLMSRDDLDFPSDEVEATILYKELCLEITKLS